MELMEKRLHIAHLRTALATLDYMATGDFMGEGGDWEGMSDKVEQARSGIEAEIDRRERRQAKRAKKANS